MSCNRTLTVNSIRAIIECPNEEDGKPHLLQIYNLKTTCGPTGKKRYALKFSDGSFYLYPEQATPCT